MPLISLSRSIWVIDQVAVLPSAGSREVRIRPSLSAATHSVLDGHDTAVITWLEVNGCWWSISSSGRPHERGRSAGRRGRCCERDDGAREDREHTAVPATAITHVQAHMTESAPPGKC